MGSGGRRKAPLDGDDRVAAVPLGDREGRRHRGAAQGLAPESAAEALPSVSGRPQVAELERDGRRPGSSAGKQWFEERLPSPRYRVPIFMSYSTPVNAEQYAMAKGIYAFLARRCLAPRTLGVNEYDFKTPLEAVRDVMSDSRGLLAIAFRKTNIERGWTKRRHGREEPREQMLRRASFASPWVQIEVAMAYQWRLPVLVLRERGVIPEGLLEPGVVSFYMPEFDLGKPANHFLQSQDFREVVAKWETEVRRNRPVAPELG